MSISRECVRNLDLRVQVHPGELWVSKSAVGKGDAPKICGFVLTHSLISTDTVSEWDFELLVNIISTRI